MERGPLRRRLRRRLPLGDARLRRVDRHRAPAPDRAPHPVHELVPPRRGALRRVRLELRAPRAVRHPPLAHGHDLQHEPRAPVAATSDGVRVARRRRRAHGRHDVPDVPRPPPARAARRDGARAARHDGLPPAVYGPREFFYADLFASRADGLPRPSSGCRASATSTPAASAPTWSSTTCSTSCCSRCPTTTRTRTATARSRQVTSIAAADRQIERLMHAAGGPDAFLEDHAVIVCSDHSQSQVEDEIDLFARVRRLRRAAAASEPAARRGGRDRALPGLALGEVYVLDRERRDELVPRVERTLLALEGVDLVMRMTGHPDGEAAVARDASAASCASRRGGELADLRGERWSVEGDLGRSGSTRATDGVLRSERYPDALGRVWSALRCRDGRRGPAVGRARATSSSTGAAPTTSAAARTAPCTPTTRSARCCGAAPGPTGGRARAVDAARHRAHGAGALRRRGLEPDVAGAPASGAARRPQHLLDRVRAAADAEQRITTALIHGSSSRAS